MFPYGKGDRRGDQERVTRWANTAESSPPPSCGASTNRAVAEARDAAVANRKGARAGGDLRTKRLSSVPTFEQAAAKVSAMHCLNWADRHAGQVDGDAADVRVSLDRPEGGGPDQVGR